MFDSLTEIQTTYDSLASRGHPIEEMQHTSIILNGIKGQFDNVIVVIHARRKPYEIAPFNSVLLYTEYRQFDFLFDTAISTNVVVNSSSNGNH